MMVESGLGFSVSGEMSVFGGNHFWGLGDWQWGAMMTISWKSPVRDDWSVNGMNNWSGMVSHWSMWQVGG